MMHLKLSGGCAAARAQPLLQDGRDVVDGGAMIINLVSHGLQVGGFLLCRQDVGPPLSFLVVDPGRVWVTRWRRLNQLLWNRKTIFELHNGTWRCMVQSLLEQLHER